MINVTFPNNDRFKPNISGGPGILLNAFVDQKKWDNQLEYYYNQAKIWKF